MPDHQWRFAALLSTLEDGSYFARSLLLPGVSCYALGLDRLRQMLASGVTDAMKQLPPGDVYRFLPAEMPDVRSLMLTVPPLRDDYLRRNPVDLPLQYVVWKHAGDALIAFVPALGIEVLAENEKQLAELLQPQITMALSRSRITKSLAELARLARFQTLSVRPLSLKVHLPTLKEAALEKEFAASKAKSILKEVGTRLPDATSPAVHQRDADVERLAQLLTRSNPRSVLLVGRSGVGKTALVYELARRQAALGLPGTPIWSTSGSRIVAGMTGFGMWQERCENLVREAGKAKAILHLGNLVELIEVGKGGGNLQGVAAMLRPHVDRGAFLAIVECTPEQLAVVEREDPQLLETFTQFELSPSNAEQTRAILQAVAEERRSGPQLAAEGLATLDRLHRRWATYSAAPGRQLRFLRNLLEDRSRWKSLYAANGDAERRPEITASIVTAAFSHETGLPLFLLDDDIPLDLARTHTWFTERVIGQPAAVDQVVQLLAAVKAGLARGGKPIASLLFIGPTGVGKTEMAKSLAEFLYQDRGRMIRFDMSEYSHPAAVERLIGGAWSAQGLLTQKVRDQPFTVVLLDEFEKAHPQFFDVLLQVLGEGRLTDGAGRVTDVTNSVVIMTSNLGADSFRRGTVGFGGEAATADFAERHFEREVKAFLRPEMFNRLDRIVPFQPLDRATIGAIARRELEQVAARDGLKFRQLSLQVDDDVIDRLAAAGFDPRYGARPLKRTIERQLVTPLADGLNRYSPDLKLNCTTQRDGDRLRVEVQARTAGNFSDPNASATAAAELVVGLRRHVQALQHSGVLTRLSNEIERIRQEQQTREKRLKKRGLAVQYSFTAEQARLMKKEELLHRTAKLAQDVIALEDDTLTKIYSSQKVDAPTIEACRVELDATFRQILFDLPQVEGERRQRLTIAAFGESLPAVVELMRIYFDICKSNVDDMRWVYLKMYRQEHDETLATPGRPFHPPPGPQPVCRLLSRQEHEEQIRDKVIDVYAASKEDPFSMLPQDCIGLAVEITGARSVSLLQTETGKHEFLRTGGGKDVCFVEAINDRLLNYDPPKNVGRRGGMDFLAERRTYDFREEECRDPRLKRSFPIRARRIDEPLRQAVEEYLTVRLWELIEAWS